MKHPLQPPPLSLPPGVDAPLEACLRAAIDYHAVLAVTDADGTIIDLNENFCRISGYRREELLGKNHRMIKSDRHSDGFFSAMWKTITEGKVWSGTVCNRTKTGKEYWVESTILPLLGNDGNPVGYLALRTDVTPLKEAEHEKARLISKLTAQDSDLKLAEGQLTTFFRHAPIGISWREMDEHGIPRTNHVNDRFCEIIGLNKEEAKDIRNIMRVTHPEDWKAQEKLTNELYQGRMDRFSLDKRYLRPDGRVVWACLTVAVLRDGEGKVTHHFAMLEDITARRMAERELRGSEARWRTYLGKASEILYALKGDLTIKFLSPAWTAKLGYSVEATMGKPILDYIHRDDRKTFRDFVESILEGEESESSSEYRILHQKGHWIWHASSGTRYSDRDGKAAFFGVGRDIDIRRRTQEELKAALNRRKELERIINRSPSVVVLWKSNGTSWPVEFISASVAQFGYQPEDFIAARISYLELIHPEDRDRVIAEVQAYARTGVGEYNQEYRIQCSDGRLVWVNDHTICRRDESGQTTHHEGVITDITLRKRSEEIARESAEKELRLASAVQQHLLPSQFMAMKHLEVEGLSQPSLHLGGDYYDILKVDETHFGFVIADVSGKGAPAALMMAACRASLRSLASGNRSPSSVIRKLNETLLTDMPPRMFITLFYGIIDTGNLTLTYCRAGHEPGLLFHAAGEAADLLEAGGMAVGIIGGDEFANAIAEEKVALQEGDLIALYTDGITEACNAEGEEFGIERLEEAFHRYRKESLSHMLTRLDRHLRQYGALVPAQDDRTLLLVRVDKEERRKGKKLPSKING